MFILWLCRFSVIQGRVVLKLENKAIVLVDVVPLIQEASSVQFNTLDGEPIGLMVDSPEISGGNDPCLFSYPGSCGDAHDQ